MVWKTTDPARPAADPAAATPACAQWSEVHVASICAR
jgi:hypothetical protein